MVTSGHYQEIRSVFLRPHEVEALEARLLERGRDSPELITQKQARAVEELAYLKAHDTEFSRVIVNATAEVALGELKDAALFW
jgi:guanylate kinase